MHTSHLVKDTMGYLCTAALPHPLYFSELAICDYFLFTNVKNHLRCRIFESRYKLSIAIMEVLKMVSHDGLSNFMGFDECMERYNNCFRSRGLTS